jgi:hypothetical protein
MGARINLVRRFLRELRSGGRDSFAGLLDFSYQHYALGDALTTQVNLACLAKEAGCDTIDLFLFVDPVFPAAPTQGFINRENYPVFLDAMFPALLCLPQLRSLRLIRDSMGASLLAGILAASRTPMWPTFAQHLRRRVTYPLGHDIINRFFAREGYVPQLVAPRGYARWARQFLDTHWPGRYRVCINPRQSRLSPVPLTMHRDSPLEEWHAFIDAVAIGRPDVQFLMLGGFAEWDAMLARRPNVCIPRMMGLSLAHELALLHAADLFMGASSGFATMATFTSVPYLITNIEHGFGAFAGIPPGSGRYPFARDDQLLVWHREDKALLMAHLEAAYARAHGGREARAAAC